MTQIFEQSIEIAASVAAVERCLTDLHLMHRWLNPALRCEPVGEWSTDVGSRSRFIIQIPFVKSIIKPTLECVTIARAPGLIVWGFEGFFQGSDRWECQPAPQGTRLVNRFEFTIPNPIVNWGFQTFAAPWTQSDMKTQLQRLKQVAEGVSNW